MSKKIPMQFPNGAVYFRKSNPPQDDWERDYAQAAKDSMNIFRHWFLWGVIETSPGNYDWAEYDRQLELAAKNGIKTIIAEMITAVPEWIYRRHPEYLMQKRDGSKIYSTMSPSCCTGGFGGVCLDNPDAKKAAGVFLTELAKRYKGHPGFLGFDIWNECNSHKEYCYCEHTRQTFITWLKKKYQNNLQAFNRAWLKFSYAEWDDILIPLSTAPYPECYDWYEFRRENYLEQMRWRVETIRAVDKDCLIAAHGIRGGLGDLYSIASDDWGAADLVETYGITWIGARKGTEPYKQFLAMDFTRAASRGKQWWHAETQGGPLWIQPQVLHREKEDGRVAVPEDLRIWRLTSMACGARGLLNLRWRPLLNGPLFGAFGAYGMDGKPTERSEMQRKIGKWANDPAQKGLVEALPIHGETGIIYVRESQLHEFLLDLENSTENYVNAITGAYRAFFDANIQADFVLIDDIDTYDTLYLPYPIMLKRETAEKLTNWVKKGGKLICEGCPAYFGDLGWVSPIQPAFGLDSVFGATQSDVEFMPDIGHKISLNFDFLTLKGGLFKQTYEAHADAIVRGRYSDGGIACVEHSFGKGKTLLVGTHVSEGYQRTQDASNRAFFANLLLWAGKEQSIQVSNKDVKARLHTGTDGTYLWLLNYASHPSKADIVISAARQKYKSVQSVLWGRHDSGIQNNCLSVVIEGKDALIIKLE